MKTVNEMKLCVPSKSCNEAFARCVVSAFVMSLDPTVNELSDLKTAVSEAVTNCIVTATATKRKNLHKRKNYLRNKVIITTVTKAAEFPILKRQWNRCLQPLPRRTGQDSALQLCRAFATRCVFVQSPTAEQL